MVAAGLAAVAAAVEAAVAAGRAAAVRAALLDPRRRRRLAARSSPRPRVLHPLDHAVPLAPVTGARQARGTASTSAEEGYRRVPKRAGVV